MATMKVTSVEDLVWYLTDSQQWWPSLLEELDPDSIESDGLSTNDQGELMHAIIDCSSIYRVTLVGKKKDATLLLCPASKAACVIPLLHRFKDYYVGDAQQQEHAFGTELAGEYREGIKAMKLFVDDLNPRNKVSAPAPADKANEARRVSVAPETAAKQLPVESAASSSDHKQELANGSDFSNGNDDDSYGEEVDSEIKSHDDWDTVWRKLYWIGWELVDGVYAKPGKMYYSGNTDLIDGVDYFTTLEGLQAYIRDEYNWSGPRKARQPQKNGRVADAPVERKLFSTPPDQPTVPQDPAKPLLSSERKQDKKSDSKTLKKASTKLAKSSSAKFKTNQKQATIRKRLSSASSDKMTQKPLPAFFKAKKKEARMTKKEGLSSTKWWQTEAVPSSKQAWKLLKKLGYSTSSSMDRFELPVDVYERVEDAPVFRSLSGLRKFLCKFGIPSNASVLSEAEKETLRRWVAFANVPVSNKDSVRLLKNVALPKNKTQLVLLLADNGFSLMSGKVWAPNVAHGSHDSDFVFDVYTEQDKMKKFVRGAWTMDSMAHSMMVVGPGDDDMSLVSSPPSAKYSRKVSDEKYLAMRFWAVASDDIALPHFNAAHAPRDAKQIRLLELVEDDTIEDDSSDGSDEASLRSVLRQPKGDEKLTVKQKRSSRGSKKNTSQGPWWQHCPLIEHDEAWRILEKLGYSRTDDGRHRLPLSVYEASQVDKHEDQPSFESLTGLRKFLCKFGLPSYEPELISEAEAVNLTRWAMFANVPVDPRNSVRILKRVSKPRTQLQLRTLLLRNGFTTVDGKFWAPGYTHGMRNGNLIFDESELSEGIEGKSKLKNFIRGAWTLDSKVLCLKETPEKPPRSKYGAATDDAHLQLRLWAAATSEPLPQFTVLPKRELEIKLMEMIPDEEFPQAYDSSDTESVMSTALSTRIQESETKRKFQYIAEVSSGTKRQGKAKKSSTSSSPEQVGKRQKVLPWYYHEDIAYLIDDWHLLQDCGWTYSSSGYHHSAWPGKRFDQIIDLRQHMCVHGIPGADELKQRLGSAAFDRLVKWVRFAHVPTLPNYFKSKIQSLSPLSDSDAFSALVSSFRFIRDGNKLFFPDSKCDCDAVHGVHYILENQVASWLRSRATWTVSDDATSRRGRQKTDTEKEELRLRLRLWAAAKDDPLPQVDMTDSQSTVAAGVVERVEDNELLVDMSVADSISANEDVSEPDEEHMMPTPAESATELDVAELEDGEIDETEQHCAKPAKSPVPNDFAEDSEASDMDVADLVAGSEDDHELDEEQEKSESEGSQGNDGDDEDDAASSIVDEQDHDDVAHNPFGETKNIFVVRKNSFGSRQRPQALRDDPAVDSLARFATQPDADDEPDSDSDYDLFQSGDLEDDEGSVNSMTFPECVEADNDMLLTQG